MPANTDGAGRHTKRPAYFVRRFLRVKGQQQDRPFPLADRAKARGNTRGVDRPFVWRDRVFLPRLEAAEQLLPAGCRSSQAHRHHPARAQDERRDLIGISNLAGAKPLDDDQHHLLREVVGGLAISEVLQSVEADAWRKPSIQLGLRFSRVSGLCIGDRSRQRSVSKRIQ